MQSTKLAIAIPTFERAEILLENILSIIPQLEEHSIPLFISDNSSDNLTEQIVNKLNKQYKFIFYFKNRTDLGHDKNSFYVVQLPEADHVWLLGDSFSIEPNGIKEVLDLIDTHKPEIISVNAANRSLDEKSGFYTGHNTVLDKFGWHLTLTGATIYSKKVISTIGQVKPELFKNFPQLSLMFKYLSKDCSFYWLNRKVINSAPKKGYWVKTMFSIFIDDWSNAIRNLPSSYRDSVKEKVIIEHSLRSNIFGFKALLKARIFDAYNYNLYKKYGDELSFHSPLNKFTLMLISIFPRFILKIILFLQQTYQALKL